VTLPRKFGSCGRCMALSLGSLALAGVMLVLAVRGDDPVAVAAAVLLVAVSAAILSLHGLGWLRRNKSSRPH